MVIMMSVTVGIISLLPLSLIPLGILSRPLRDKIAKIEGWGTF